jgi:hypothetical protein
MEETKKTIAIYKITSPSGKVYIGQTRNLEARWRVYKRCNCKQQKILFRSLKKYGSDKHIFEILHDYSDMVQNEELTDLLNTKEKELIKIYKDLGISLNIHNGGKSVRCSDDTKKKISKPVLQYDLEGYFICEWINAKVASQELKIGSNSIAKCCKGKCESVGSFTWRYKIEGQKIKKELNLNLKFIKMIK